MNIRIFTEYMKEMVNPSPEGFYNYVKANYPEEIHRLNWNVIRGMM